MTDKVPHLAYAPPERRRVEVHMDDDRARVEGTVLTVEQQPATLTLGVEPSHELSW